MLTKMKNKNAAIELSIGTVVIIVLAMTMLILGIVLIRNIFSGAIDSVKSIDQGVKNEINKLFADNQDRKLILLPDSKLIKLEQGSQDAGFALSIRNVDNNNAKQYTYKIELDNKGNCINDPLRSGGFVQIISGDQSTTPNLGPGEIMENPKHIRLSISRDAPTCTFILKVIVYEGTRASGTAYDFDSMDVQIIPR